MRFLKNFYSNDSPPTNAAQDGGSDTGQLANEMTHSPPWGEAQVISFMGPLGDNGTGK